MIAFIDAQRAAHGVEPICKVLPIAPPTYRAHAARRTDPAKLSARSKRDVVLTAETQRVFEANFRVYGVRKVWRQLDRDGPASAGPVFTRGPQPCSGMRGRCSNIVDRVVRSTSVSKSALFLVDDRPRDRSPAGARDRPGQTLLHVGPQRPVDRQLRRLRSLGRALGVPLRRAGPILQTAAARRSVAPQLSRDRRGRPLDLACNPLHRAPRRSGHRAVGRQRRRQL